MLFSFARVSAVLSLKRQDFYYQYYQGPRRWLRFHEKGGKEHEMPAHRQIEETIDEYLSKVSIGDNRPLFQSVNKTGNALSGRALNRHNAWAAIRKRARNAGFLTPVGCHTWRATGVTVYLENAGRLEHAQQMAAHESPRTTKLYDRAKDEITIGEVERIQL
jgi:integrase/recombinase XerD